MASLNQVNCSDAIWLHVDFCLVVLSPTYCDNMSNSPTACSSSLEVYNRRMQLLDFGYACMNVYKNEEHQYCNCCCCECVWPFVHGNCIQAQAMANWQLSCNDGKYHHRFLRNIVW